MDPKVERAKQGDSAALEELLESVAPAILRFGRSMCKNESDADDVLQDTLLAVATHLGEFEGRSSLTSWIFSLTRSACTRRRRGRKNQPHQSDDDLVEHPDLGPTPETAAADQELRGALGRALDALPDDYREVLLLRDVEGLTAPEAAETLGISTDALKSRLHRARGALREALRPVLEPSPASARPGCPDVAAFWSLNLEGDLAPQDCATMEKHVATCPACGMACDTLKRALSACRRVGQGEVPKEIQMRVKRAIIDFRSQRAP
ncbi:MAG: RNA polymerase sigma factor [Byssovorax sp.]